MANNNPVATSVSSNDDSIITPAEQSKSTGSEARIAGMGRPLNVSNKMSRYRRLVERFEHTGLEAVWLSARILAAAILLTGFVVFLWSHIWSVIVAIFTLVFGGGR